MTEDDPADPGLVDLTALLLLTEPVRKLKPISLARPWKRKPKGRTLWAGCCGCRLYSYDTASPAYHKQERCIKCGALLIYGDRIPTD